ncbi:trypsin-like peptidase domain-containing protein [Streptomyces sp. NPDC046465]|uniref:trypsin-like peptidase domain-containing protein n=1 Tax=Streptomyces sp. NPDC046465 TaxID=3155810 RepID=UPI0033E561CD
MDEGKPTKANWWSRPRPEVPGTADQLPAETPPPPPEQPQPADEPAPFRGQAPAAPTPEQQPQAADAAAPFPGQAPAAPLPEQQSQAADAAAPFRGQAPAAPPPEPSQPADAAAAFPGQTPAASASSPEQPSAQAPGAPAPAPAPAQAQDAGAQPQAADAPAPFSGQISAAPASGAPDQDAWTLDAPAQTASGAAPVPGEEVPPQAVDSASAPHGGAPSGSIPAAGAPYGTAGGGMPAPVPAQHPPARDGAPADRPRPLHDPDPYSTPPYGEPGPWAPAPPVQHPGATPAHGTTVPAAAPGPDPAHGTPPHGTPGPGPTPAPYNAVTHPQAPPRPRQPYDPWAAPLQQIGSVPPETVEARRKRGKRMLVGGAVVIALVSSLIGGAVGSYLERNGADDVKLSQPGAESAERPKDSVAGIASAALPGVVTLHVSGDSAEGTGTGFVLDAKGHILTNNHVVEPAGTGGEVSVTFSGGETAKAEVVGRDSGYDLAVVKVSNVHGLKPLALGNSENVQVGDPVVAIGAPFDLENTVTSGIISAKERPITAGGEKGDGSDISYVDALQTDAPINPGNSGGPLVDSKARVIGINSAIRSADEGSAPTGGQAGSIGLGFAIPVNQGKRVAEELINFGRARHPVIGVTLDTEFTGDGARIADKGKSGGPSVNRDGPGDKAGLEPGDVITEVDGRPVHSSDELIVKVRAHRPKDRLRLTVERGGDDREVTLVLGSADGD